MVVVVDARDTARCLREQAVERLRHEQRASLFGGRYRRADLVVVEPRDHRGRRRRLGLRQRLVVAEGRLGERGGLDVVDLVREARDR